LSVYGGFYKDRHDRLGVRKDWSLETTEVFSRGKEEEIAWIGG